jgi:flagella basal body P-ring formation protein FlgA
MTATGMVNGDLASYSVTSPVYQGSTGRLVPGTYVTTGSLAGLGYNVSGSGSGNLAVSPRTVGVSATKSADGDDTLTGNQVTLTTGVTGEDLIYSGAFADSSAEGANGNFIRAIVLGNGTSGVATNYRLPVLNAANAPVTITGVQFASLTAVKLAALSATQQTALLSNLTAVNLASMSNTAIAAIKPETLAGFSTGKLGSLSAAQIGQFSSAQIIQLSASGLWTELSTAQVAGLTASQLTGLTSTQVAGFTAAQLGGLTATQLSGLSAAQQTTLLSGLTAAKLAGISNAALAAIEPSTLAGFASGQLSSLSAAQIGQFSSAQLIQLSASGLWTELSTAQVAGLTAAQLTVLSSAQVAGFTAAQLGGLSSAQVAVFTVAQLGGLTDTQRSALSGSQNNQGNPLQSRVQTERAAEAANQAMQSAARASPSFTMASMAVNPAARVSSADVKVELVRSPELQTAGLVTVSMPSDVATNSAGLAFALPNELLSAISNAVNVDATLVGGQPLPPWLRFDSANGQFLVGNVANVSFPLELNVQLGTQAVMVVISVRSI